MQLTFGQKWHSNSDLTRSGSSHSAFQSALVLAQRILHYVRHRFVIFTVFLGICQFLTAWIGWFLTGWRNGAEIYDLIMSCKCSEIKFKVDKDDDWIIWVVDWFQTEWGINRLKNLKALMRDLGIEREQGWCWKSGTDRIEDAAVEGWATRVRGKSLSMG